jgi:hypothetical protein
MRHFDRADIVFFVPPDYARLTIVFDLQADPIAGVVCDDAGDSGVPFAGWMEFTRAVERALNAARRAPGAASQLDAGVPPGAPPAVPDLAANSDEAS